MATLVEYDPRAPFSIATTSRFGEGATPFPGLLHFSLDLYLIVLSAKQVGIRYHFWVLGITRPGIEPRSPGPLANTLYLLSQWPVYCIIPHNISYLSDPPYFFAYNTNKTKLIFFVMQWWWYVIRSLVKIITTHTHTHE